MGKSDCSRENLGNIWAQKREWMNMDETAQLLYKHLINAMAYPNGIQLQILRKKWWTIWISQVPYGLRVCASKERGFRAEFFKCRCRYWKTSIGKGFKRLEGVIAMKAETCQWGSGVHNLEVWLMSIFLLGEGFSTWLFDTVCLYLVWTWPLDTYW